MKTFEEWQEDEREGRRPSDKPENGEEDGPRAAGSRCKASGAPANDIHRCYLESDIRRIVREEIQRGTEVRAVFRCAKCGEVRAEDPQLTPEEKLMVERYRSGTIKWIWK